MGWASGSGLAENVWLTVRDFVPGERQAAVAAEILHLFEEHDADDFGCYNALYVAARPDECQPLACPVCGLENLRVASLHRHLEDEHLDGREFRERVVEPPRPILPDGVPPGGSEPVSGDVTPGGVSRPGEQPAGEGS